MLTSHNSAGSSPAFVLLSRHRLGVAIAWRSPQSALCVSGFFVLRRRSRCVTSHGFALVYV